MRRPVFDVNGVPYMDTKTAASRWEVKAKTVAEYCRQKRIPGAFKDRSNIWCIPINTIKPPQIADIQLILLLPSTLKKNPSYTIDLTSTGISKNQLYSVYDYLAKCELIDEFDHAIPLQDLPYNIQITKKGEESLKEAHDIEKTDIKKVLADNVSLIISLGNLLINIGQLFQ